MVDPAAYAGAFRTGAAGARSAVRAASSSSSTSSWTSSSIRRFPLPGLHVGTDVCNVARIYGILCGRDAADAGPAASRPIRFVHRILTPQELPPPAASAIAPLPALPTPSKLLAWLQARISQIHTPVQESHEAYQRGRTRDESLWMAAQFLAGRFAAKEAVIKAHPHIHLTFQQIRIVRQRDDRSNGSGPPLALLQLADPEAQRAGQTEQEALISISHDGDYATAVCIGFNHAQFPAAAPAPTATTDRPRYTSDRAGHPRATGDAGRPVRPRYDGERSERSARRASDDRSERPRRSRYDSPDKTY